MGSGNLDEFTRPAGSSMPHTVPCFWYSLRPLPAKYPRTMHSRGKHFGLLDRMKRPRR